MNLDLFTALALNEDDAKSPARCITEAVTMYARELVGHNKARALLTLELADRLDWNTHGMEDEPISPESANDEMNLFLIEISVCEDHESFTDAVRGVADQIVDAASATWGLEFGALSKCDRVKRLSEHRVFLSIAPRVSTSPSFHITSHIAVASFL